LEFERTAERLLFKINGSSDFYGTPTTEELKKIADYLQAILPKRFRLIEFQSGESEVKVSAWFQGISS
jgi:hypothetical protein